MSCVMRIAPKRSRSCSSRILSRIDFCTTTSSPVVGSSKSTSCGFSASARARLTRCFIPPESSCGNMSRKRASTLTRSNSSSARSRAAAVPAPVCSARMSSNIFRTRTTGLSEFMLDWNTVDTYDHRSGRSSSSSSVVTSRSPQRIEPPVMCPGLRSSRSTACAKVVLPEPDSPASPTNSPGATCSDTLVTASRAGPSFGRYCTDRSRTSRTDAPGSTDAAVMTSPLRAGAGCSACRRRSSRTSATS